MLQKLETLNIVYLHHMADQCQVCCSEAATNLCEPGKLSMKACDPTLALLNFFQLPSRDLQAKLRIFAQSSAFVEGMSIFYVVSACS